MPSSGATGKFSSSRTQTKSVGRQMDLHALFGGGKVADIVLWKNKQISAAVLAAATVIWFVFEIVEYPVLTLACHIAMTAMLVIFIWCNGAPLLQRAPPKIPQIILSEAQQLKDVAQAFHAKLSWFISKLYDIARGDNLKQFLLAIIVLWMLSVVGSYCSSITLLYLVILAIQTVPVLCMRYEADVHELAVKGRRDLEELYRKLDSNILGKIPRASPVEEKAR